MCGVAGTSRAGALPALEDSLAAMRHRGPDDSLGLDLGGMLLGHRRLSIIDLSPLGRQPMANETGDLHVVFNGEIYDFDQLRKELTGHQFRSRTDSEVLLHGYEEWGIEGLLRRIRGMFVFALWDARQQVLHIARDQIGKKPLFYRADQESISFASTLPALRLLEPDLGQISGPAIATYLHLLSVPAPLTMLEGAFRLPSAHRLEWRRGTGPVLSRYWEPPAIRPERRSDDEWVEAIESALSGAVQRRLVADVPVGLFLSGGLDSGLVASLAAELAGGKLQTLSMGFGEASDETGAARELAARLGTEHHEIVLEGDGLAALPALVAAFGEPFGDHAALPTWRLSQRAREHVTVVLTGDGGDELFGGYPMYAAARATGWLHCLPGSSLLGAPAGNDWLNRRGVFRKALTVASGLTGRHGRYRFDPLGVRTFRGRMEQLAGPRLRAILSQVEVDAEYDRRWEESRGHSWSSRAQHVDQMTQLPEVFLTKTDCATMAHSLEARCPFLDLALLELSRRIPSGAMLRGMQTKHLIRRLADRRLGREASRRRKQGFAPPTDRWFRGPRGQQLAGIICSETALGRGWLDGGFVRQLVSEHQSGTVNHGQRLWLLLMLELWFRMFVDQTLSREDDLFEVAAEKAVAA